MVVTNEDEILRAAIAHYGENNQILKAIEELSELIQPLSKHIQGHFVIDHILEELADVSIVVDQLKIIFNAENMEFIREAKLKRLLNRMAGTEEGSIEYKLAIIKEPE